MDSLASAAKTSVLRDLKITQCRISDSAAKMIGSLMGSDGSLLQVLDLGLNGISDSGAIAIAEGLGRNTHMTTLMLTGAPSSMRDTDGEWGLIGDAGAVAIAKALMGNTHSKLQILDLSRGNIGDIGARAIGEMLQDDQHLVLPVDPYSLSLCYAYNIFTFIFHVICVLACFEAAGEYDQ